jgi:flavin-dependent dehydrogenase
MRVAIAGAGMAGAYLNRLLAARGHSVEIFDRRTTTKCGLTPCAWGTSRGFNELVADVGLKPSNYVLMPSKDLFMDEVKVPADLWTFDKRRLIDDLLRGAQVHYSSPDPSKFDRIIDATGVSRAFLPSISGDIALPCVQYRIRTETAMKNRVKLGAIGYAWSFPLSDREYHVGCGSFVTDPKELLKGIGWIRGEEANHEILCSCKGKIRLTGPQRSLPFIMSNGISEVWGVGEAIGCVAPLAGDGVVPGMRSAQLLTDWWDDPEGYATAILQEFSWMGNERRVVDRLIANERLGLRDALILKRNSARMGMGIGLKDALTLLLRLR